MRKTKEQVTPIMIAEKFISGESFNVKGYHSDGKKLSFRTMRTRQISIKGKRHAAWLRENEAKGFIQILNMWETRAQVRGIEEDIIAIKVETPQGMMTLGNSSVLPLIGRRMIYGDEKLNRNETEIQAHLAKQIPMIPFSVLKTAQLDIRKLRIIERGPEETVKRWETHYSPKTKEDVRELVPRHFTGASLFEVQGKFFLFDLDRREVEEGIFNPFLVELPAPADSISRAYISLIPEEVYRAGEAGLKVLRQGEWFFIPCIDKAELELAPDMRERGAWENAEQSKPSPKRLELRAGPNRPNIAEEGIEKKGYVRGKIEHQGREHAPLILPCWHKAVPNTATKSFTITGDID